MDLGSYIPDSQFSLMGFLQKAIWDLMMEYRR